MSKVNPQHWQQVKRVFESALERSDNERAEFLDQVCAGDAALRKEVESLLQSYREAGSFMEAPAVASAAESLVGEQNKLVVGQRVKHYEILTAIGEGGMGEVYLAKDTILGRRVALKLLFQYVSNDPDRLRRFKQEARTASTLSHPNVCVIHEIGETDEGQPFITMEYIEGATLRERMKERAMKLGDALDIAIQVADALHVAHEAGIVHRDIKPENIMIRRDGYVKVLDFGLAKLTEPRERSASGTMSTLLVKSSPGTVMGTAAYMSPEQARGVSVDERTDIWSLGVVLYEMVSGRPPFAGGTPSDLIVSILDREPIPFRLHSREVPAELGRIAQKALRKDREERYQVVKDMALDLKSLRHELEIEAERERSAPPALIDDAHAGIGGGQASFSTADGLPTDTDEVGAAQPTTSLEFIVSKIQRHKRGAVITLASLLFLATGLGFGLYKLLNRKQAVVPFQTTNISKLTTSGNAVEAAISPDGKYVAYLLEEGGKQTLWLRQVAINSSVQIGPGGYQGLIFSPDGNYLYYGVQIEQSPLTFADFALYQVPVLGGPTKKILEHLSLSGRQSVTFSPDGKRVAFIRFKPDLKETALFLANADGTSEQLLLTRREQNLFGTPAWSPDGKTLACEVLDPAGYDRLVGIQVADGKEQTLTEQRWAVLGMLSIEWLPDGNGLLVSAMSQSSPFTQLWYVSYPERSARKIINDLNNYMGASLTADASALVSVQSNYVSNLWLTPLNDARHAAQITSGASRYYDLSWTPQGKIVYATDASGSADIWLMEANGTGNKQLTANAGRNYGPTATPDGRYIVFHSDRTGVWNIWRMNMDGSNQIRLAPGEWATVSPDGNWVIYEGYPRLSKISINGGEPATLLNILVSSATISPDGKLIACQYKEQENAPWKVVVIPFDGGRPLKILDIPIIAQPGPSYRWTPDGRALVYLDTRNGVSNLWLQTLDGSRPRQLTDFKSEAINSFDLARDGRLIISRGTSVSDVVLVGNVR